MPFHIHIKTILDYVNVEYLKVYSTVYTINHTSHSAVMQSTVNILI